ncbi:YeeE/YedE family protein [uncultured Aquitalea sp.]|uniref:YeeE/YedE family protein n=1 Tax=uncultured Aquitalea sp. TaxID=540272 RepID=UPI0025F55969|nr:YeeE/YedE family protein [uncultured Aquitalea sp.]
MQIAWNSFTPYASLAGGVLIGLAAAWLVLLNGRIAGISGIVGGLLDRQSGWPWRLAFTGGLLLAPLAWLFAVGPWPVVRIEASPLLLIVAGLLVGAGTRLASGCTSGHGVCGLSRLSPRSLVATLSFMGAGFATVFLIRHVLG